MADPKNIGNVNNSNGLVGNGSSKSNSIEIPQISLPKGGGAIKGIEEKFQVNSVTGTSSFSIPLPFSAPSRGGPPPMGLSYNSGSGNSPFGLGWQMGIPSITRKTEKQIPEYRDEDESDVFTLSGSEDLIPLLEKSGDDWVRHSGQRTVDSVVYNINRYRPRTEGAFARIEKWQNKRNGEVFWKTISGSNVHSYFGLTENSRIHDPNDSSRVFSWKLCRIHDDKGNITLLEYKHEDFVGIEKNLSEKNRINNCTQIYIKKALYGNKVPYYLGDDIPGEDDFMFKAVFDYGEHDTSENIPQNIYEEANSWLSRKDPFSSYRSGFEVRTYRRCERVLMFHCFDDKLVHTPYLTKSLQLFYDDNLEYSGSGRQEGGFSYLASFRQNGHLWDSDVGHYSTKYVPEMQLDYQQHEWNTDIKIVEQKDVVHSPSGLQDKKYLWIDLFSEGVSGILTEQASGWYYKRNLGEGRFENAFLVSPKPSFTGITDGTLAIQDIEGDGSKYLVHHASNPKGFFKFNDEENWEQFKHFSSYPTVGLSDANTRSIDLTGDGRADLLRTEENSMLWYESVGEVGFAVSKKAFKAIDEENGPAILFSDQTQSIFISDMCGDGLSDIVRIRNGEICYWPNLGYGNFGPKVSMDNSPWFDTPERFNPQYLRLADIDGSGTIDIIYLGKNDFRVWMNQSGNGWSEAEHIINAFPSIHNLSDIQVLDFLGSGTACIVYSTSLGKQPMQYIDLMGSKKPHLLKGYENNCGMETSITYKPSTYYYLEDKKEGKDWITKLPFPVHCVDSVRIEDKIRETVFTSSYRYRHGYYDHEEREFRGFARVETLDTEEFTKFKLNEASNVVQEDLHQPPIKTIFWFHTGAYLKNRKIIHQCESEYFQNNEFTEYELPEPVFEEGLSAKQLREAYRALKGLQLRSEVYAEDNSDKSSCPYSASQATFEVRMIQPEQQNRYASFITISSESISYNYERNPADPRISHLYLIEADELGNVTKSASVIYPRVSRPTVPNEIADKVWDEQNKIHITYGEAIFTNDILQDDIYRLRSSYESKSYEISGVTQPAEFFITKDQIISDISSASEILFEVDFTSGLERRLSSHSRKYFIKDDFSGAMGPGELSTLAIGYKSYSMAFTKDLVSKYYGSKVTDIMLTDAKYVHLEGDQHWWSQSGTAIYSSNPANDFYMPIGGRDVFGNESFVSFDSYKFLPESTTDAIGNTTTSSNDYRTLSPVMVTDQNLNRTAVETDELGMTVKHVVMGKDGDGDGDTLNDPTSIMEYEMFNWQNNGKPNYVRILSREKHGSANPGWQEAYFYSDGGGSVIMSKGQAEPGLAKHWDEVTESVEEVDADPRWIGNGRTIINNKGNPIKQYESFFSTTHEYESEAALVEVGETPIIYYDPVGRNIRTELPNGTFSKTEFDPWHITTFDVNDTVKDSQWYVDRGSPDPDADPEPTDEEERAAWLAAKHHGTTSIIYSDSRGQTCYSVSNLGGGKTIINYSESDLLGRFSKVYDQLGRLVSEGYINMLGAVMYSKSSEKGERWVFADVMGRAVRTWDNSTRELWSTFDELHRPVSSYVKEGGTEHLINHVVYGDLVANAEQSNLKGQTYQLYDQSGVVTITNIDFKGNALAAKINLCKEYKQIVDWNSLAGLTNLSDIQSAAQPLLESEEFTSSSELDALNRPITTTLPDGSIIRPIYNIAGFLDKLEVKIRGQGNFVTFLEDQDYNAKGERQFAEYGNGLITNYFYDPKSFRLVNLITKQKGLADVEAVQNLSYVFDPVGNIVFSKDEAKQTHFFKNTVVKPENHFVYDSIYRLTKASGREHDGIGLSQPTNGNLSPITSLPHVNDVNAVRNYTENYEYDDCGNIIQMSHVADSGNWTRHYDYNYQSNPSDNSNRLKSTSSPGDPDGGPYSNNYQYDEHGNMISMPHLGTIEWNFADQLKSADLGGGGFAYYVYSAGRRRRKVIERQGGIRTERIYLGLVEIYREYLNNNKKFERNTLHLGDDTGNIAQIDTKILDTDNSDPSNPLNADLIRYQYTNHLGSDTLETDENGIVISYEEFHPYGTSSYRNSKSGFDISLKRYRFSGKERDDETGLYYFGARYYAPWLGRWTSSDPAGFVSGTNLYVYCSNNPIMRHDPNGMEDGKIVNDPTLGRSASFSTLQEHVPAGYRIRAGINATNYRSHWTSDEGGYWDILEEIPEDEGGTPGSVVTQTGVDTVTANPEGHTHAVADSIMDDPVKRQAYTERVQGRDVAVRSRPEGQTRGSRTADLRRESQPLRDAYEAELPGGQRPAGTDIDHTVELQDIRRGASVRPQDHQVQDSSLNKSQGSSQQHVNRRALARGVQEDVPAGGIARESELHLPENSVGRRTTMRRLGYAGMAAGPVFNAYAAYHVENDAVRYTAYGLTAAEAGGVGMYAWGRVAQGGGVGGTARGLQTMARASSVMRYAGGGAGLVVSTYSLVNNFQNENYGVMLGDGAGMVASGAVIAGSAPVAAIATGVALSNTAGDVVESYVTPEYGRTTGVAAGTLAGAAVGAAAGAAIGVWFFGVGAAPAAAVGAAIGGVAGFIGAYW